MEIEEKNKGAKMERVEVRDLKEIEKENKEVEIEERKEKSLRINLEKKNIKKGRVRKGESVKETENKVKRIRKEKGNEEEKGIEHKPSPTGNEDLAPFSLTEVEKGNVGQKKKEKMEEKGRKKENKKKVFFKQRAHEPVPTSCEDLKFSLTEVERGNVEQKKKEINKNKEAERMERDRQDRKKQKRKIKKYEGIIENGNNKMNYNYEKGKLKGKLNGLFRSRNLKKKVAILVLPGNNRNCIKDNKKSLFKNSNECLWMRKDHILNFMSCDCIIETKQVKE